MFSDRPVLGLIDEGSVRARGDEIGWWRTKLGENFFYGSWRFPLLGEVRAAGNLFDSDRTVTSEEHGAGAFAQDCAALNGRRRTKQPPFSVGVAQEPVGFLGADNEAVVDGVAEHQVFRHF